MAKNIDLKGGYILVNDLEARSLFSKTQMKGKIVWEVGCGTLPVTMALPSSDMPSLFMASDVSQRIVEEARALEPRPFYFVCSALDPAIKPSSLDVIVLNGVLHHLPPECNLLDVLRKLLTPDGVILLLEPNVSCGPAEFIKWALKRFLRLSMEASPYGQFSHGKILSLVEKAKLSVKEEWFASLFAFPLTGGQGRCKILPDSRLLFRFLVALDENFSRLINLFPPIARFLHWRVLMKLAPLSTVEQKKGGTPDLNP